MMKRIFIYFVLIATHVSAQYGMETDLSIAMQHPEDVVQLELIDLGLEGPAPDEVCLFPRMSWLALSTNSIVSLPDCIGSLKRLAFLEINENRLKELPSTLGRTESWRC